MTKGNWIKNVATGTVLDLCEGKKENGNPIIGYPKEAGNQNQLWDLVEMPGHPGIFTIHLRADHSIVIDLAAGLRPDGTAVLAWKGHGGDNQKWYMEDAGDGKKRFRNVASETYLDLENETLYGRAREGCLARPSAVEWRQGSVSDNEKW
ncbi:ricin B lectin domain-containing protein [Coprinopsis sp. MPI-PUGE-AT-0042]|nr:ricin B lectin domain-containing protein [Coprinopsis sp. MPI-PUGE-AT-0042]